MEENETPASEPPTEQDLDRIERSEDLNLGRQWHLLVGYSSPTFGGIGNRWIVQGAASDGWRPTSRQLVLAQLGVVICIGVLLDTLVVRSLLVPALVHDLGRRTWWPSALSRHQEHGLHKVAPDLE